MKFQSDRSLFVTFMIFGAVILMLVVSAQTFQHGGPERWTLLILATVIAFLLWMFFGTYYVIEANELRYRSGPINGVIPINSIRKVEVSKTQFAGLKPALASNGCVIHYNKYDEIYLSPKGKTLFVAELQKINPAIVVTGQM